VVYVVRILTVNSADLGGGAERVGRELHQAYEAAGEEAWLAVGTKRGTDPHTIEIPNRAARSGWARAWMGLADALPHHGAGVHVARALRETVAEPMRWAARRRGEEDFYFPGTAQLLTLGGGAPDIVHLHTLHDGYFDLRALPKIIGQVLTVLSLHDAWLLSGHCAHSFDCGRWETGCGDCPALWIYPAVPRDETAFNWRRKRDIFAASALHVAVPCEWLADRVRRSMLMPAVRTLKVIPYGIDLDVFFPASKDAVRRELGLDPDCPVMLVFANSVRDQTWKDGAALRGALERLGAAAAGAQWIALGETGENIEIGNVSLRRVGSEPDDRRFAKWLQAGTAYVHPARADSSPLIVMESLACGTPVIATSVGGIPEQIADGETGTLVAGGNPAALARAIDAVIALDREAHDQLCRNAAESARIRFDSRRHVSDYLEWMRELTAAPSGVTAPADGRTR
jgi:glycosyltransferase involved in cell wall biosynthesis